MINKINQLRSSEIKSKIEKRIKEFENQKDWFSELCFCLLTANWKAKQSINLQKKIGKGFACIPKSKLQKLLKKEGHRFHPQRAEYICLARKYKNIKSIIKKQSEPRQWLVKNIKGLGMKESSHFLRNVGYKNYAILDRHIVGLLAENKIITLPKTLTKNRYLEIEKKFNSLAKQLNMTPAELDLYMFYLKTNEVLK